MNASDLARRLDRFAAEWELWKAGDRIVVAVSGGMDSVVLLRLLHALGLDLVVAHADHGLRGAASDADASFVRALAGRLGYPVFVERVEVQEKTAGVQAAARAGRYAFLQRVAENAQSAVIATGHHADDLAETVLMQLARGAGPVGQGGLPVKRPLAPDSAISVVRPLLAAPPRRASRLRRGRRLAVARGRLQPDRPLPAQPRPPPPAARDARRVRRPGHRTPGRRRARTAAFRPRRRRARLLRLRRSWRARAAHPAARGARSRDSARRARRSDAPLDTRAPPLAGAAGRDGGARRGGAGAEGRAVVARARADSAGGRRGNGAARRMAGRRRGDGADAVGRAVGARWGRRAGRRSAAARSWMRRRSRAGCGCGRGSPATA